MLDISGLLIGLAQSRKVFHSEADFQHALAWHIHEAMPKSQIRLEVDVMQVERQRRSLEVWPESHWPGFALRQADVLQVQLA